ncbi:MAG TPA: hypothetical protein VJU87_10725 [Gemmatimonadaceae bacterium]|nr:hypothetical protein [Gemmatimonadaceae bacterium]
MRLPFLRRLPWWPIGITLVVLVSAIFSVSPLRDAVMLAPPADVRLDLSPGYIAIAPASDVLDTLTLLTVPQHIALLLWLFLLYAVYRVWRRRAPGVSVRRSHRHPGVREAVYAGILLLAIIAVYAIGALAPRPMAALVASPADLYLRVDFHSHTRFSHDGRSGWSAEDVRDWHRAAGFDVAYISDHRTFEGAERGIANNPPLAGQGTTILQAIEVGWRGEHVNLLGAGRMYKGLTDIDLRDLDQQALTLASAIVGREPVVVETIPGRVDSMIPATGPGTAGVRALEIVDGSPRGLLQSRRDRTHLVQLADSLGLAAVAGSDNHGWGSTAPAWTLMRMPGWRELAPDDLALGIENQIRRFGRSATRVIERRIAGPMNGSGPVELALTLPLVLWRMFTMLTTDERVVWLVWAWGLALVARAATRQWRRQQLPVA